MAKDWTENHSDGGGRERWLVTYADLITLLLVFFIVMYALSSRISGEKFDALASSLSTSMRRAASPKPSDRTAFSRDRSTQNQRYQATADAVFESFMKTDPKSDVRVDIDERGVVVSLVDTSFFPPGSAALTASGAKVLRSVAAPMRNLPNEIHVEGHTDSAPIRTAQYPSNWELSAHRAATVTRYLITKCGIASSRVRAIGFAETKPVASNGTADGRRRNRRVDLIVARPIDRPTSGAGLTGQGATAPTPAPTPVAPPRPNNPFGNPFGR